MTSLEMHNQANEFLKEKTAVVTQTGTEWVVISTPFIGLFNDMLEIYAKREDGRIVLSDDGATLKNLETVGTSLEHSSKRREILDRILLTYGVKFADGELLVEATDANFGQRKHNLISAISEVNDMYMLAKNTVASVFKEDMQGYLDEQGIIYTPQFISKGSTGSEFTFDFQIAYRDKEIVIKAFNSMNKLNLPSFLFSWEDIKPVRERLTQKEVIAIAVVNDEMRAIQPEYLEALSSKHAGIIPWSERNSDIQTRKLKAE